MKRLMIIMILACTYSMCHAQEELFKKYSGTKGVENVYISKTLLRLMPKSAVGDKDISRIAGKLEHIRILNCEKKELIPAIKKDAENFYKKKSYELVMETNEDDEQVYIYLRKMKNKQNEFVIFSLENNELAIISIVGNITLEDVESLQKDN